MSVALNIHESVRHTVLNFVKNRRIPHAILIEGDSDAQKLNLAEFIANAAVCSGENPPCDICDNCRLFSNHGHPDITVISSKEGKKNILVDQIREIRASAFVRPHQADRRVFILENAQRMNEQAQNAFLKVLEEPPESVIFILIVPSRTDLLDTVISRCTLLSLPSHENADMRMGAKKGKTSADDKAQEFLNLLFSGSEYEMLKLLHPMEKNRLVAEEFFKALQIATARLAAQCPEGSLRARVLDSLYDDTKQYLEFLKTNINLALLFSTVVCKTKGLLEQ